jgi:hypothetical protein
VTLFATSIVLVLAFTYAVFLADPRMHLPFDPVLIAVAPLVLRRITDVS